MEYKIPYGKGEQVVSLPEEHVSQVLLPPVIDKPQTVAKLMEEALAHPIGTPTLEQLVKPGEKVVLLVSDITRAWARFDYRAKKLCCSSVILPAPGPVLICFCRFLLPG